MSELITAPWKKRDIASALLMCLIWLLTSFVNSIAFPEASVDSRVFLTLGMDLVFAMIVLYLAVGKRNMTFSNFGLSSFRLKDLALGCGLLLGVFGFNFIYSIVLYYTAPDLPTQAGFFAPVLQGTSYPIFFVVMGSVFIPITEEIFFRGFVFSSINKFYGFKVAAILSSLIFASLHFVLSSLLPIFVLSLAFCYLFKRTGSLIPGIIMHSLLNTVSLLVLWFLVFNLGV